MNALHVLFRTSRFNLSRAGEHFVNPCCFGEDLAVWLRTRLTETGISAPEARQEDWGWQFRAGNQAVRYWIGVGGNSDALAENPDQGKWRIIILKKRSAWELISGTGIIGPDDRMTAAIEEIVRAEPMFRDVRRETDHQALHPHVEEEKS